MQSNFPIGSGADHIKHAYVGTPCGTANASTENGYETLTIVRFWKEVTPAMVAVNTTTAIELIPNNFIGTNRTMFPQRMTIAVAGTTAWTNVTSIKFQDSYSTAVVFSTTLVAALTSTSFCISMPGLAGPTTNTTGSTVLHRETGGTPGYGLVVLITSGVTDAVAGSNLVLSGWAFVR